MPSVSSGLFSAPNTTSSPAATTLIVNHSEQPSTMQQMDWDRQNAPESGGVRNTLIVELSMDKDSQGQSYKSQADDDLRLGGEWAVTSPKEKADWASESKNDILLEDLEDTSTDDHECFFEKLSDIPAVRDQQEIEAADRALEALAHKSPHKLTAADRIWELAARGGSTQPGETVALDSESKERVKETLRKNKLTDKTTLAF